MPNGRPPPSRRTTGYVSLAAPGASAGDCRFGVFSTLPATTSTPVDHPRRLRRDHHRHRRRALRLRRGHELRGPDRVGARRARVAGRAAARLRAGRRGAHRSAAAGRGWNQFTGAGVVDGMRAVELARVYDVARPARATRACAGTETACASASSADARPDARAATSSPATCSYGLLVSRDGGSSFHILASRRSRAFTKNVRIRGSPRQRAREHRLRRERQLRRQAARPLPPARLHRVYR